jgi:DNA polymerase-3 subunit delta
MIIKDAINDLKTGSVFPIYYLKGGDQFLQSFFIQKVSETFFGDLPEEKTLMLPDDMKGKEILDRLTMRDLFASKKLFILRDPQQIKGKVGDDLLAYCRKPMSNHVLVLINDDWMKKAAFFTHLEKITDPINTQTPFSPDINKWANYFFKERGKGVHSSVVNIMVEMAGDSVAHLNNEIEKVCLWAGNRPTIEAKDIEMFSGWKRERQRWEFLLALGNKDFPKAISLGKTIITSNDTMIALLYPLTTMFTEMLFVKMKNGTFTEPHGYMPIPPSVKKRIPYFSRGFTIAELESALNELSKIDKRQKTTFSHDETELIQFIGHVIG